MLTFFLRKGGVIMDRISAILIFSIILLVMASGMIIYDTWIADKNITYEIFLFTNDKPRCL